MNENEWYRNNMYLSELVGELFDKRMRKNENLSTEKEMEIMEWYNKIIELLIEYNIENVTVGDIKALIGEPNGKNGKTKLNNRDIIKFIIKTDNRERLIRLGQLRNPIDTTLNDENKRQFDLEAEERW